MVALTIWAATGDDVSPWLIAALALSLLGDVYLMLPRQLPLPEAVEPATRDVTQIERGSARASHALRAAHEVGEKAEIEVDVLAPIVRKARAQQRLTYVADGRYMNRFVVERRPAAAARRKHLPARRLVHDAELQLVTARERERQGELRIAVCEVRGAVDRVKVPGIPVRPRPLRPSARRGFLGDEDVIGKGAPQPLDHKCLHLAIGSGHQIERTLVLDRLGFAPRET